MSKPGAWTTKATETFTLGVPVPEAIAACTRAAEQAKGWHVEESAADRLQVKRVPGAFSGPGQTHHIEILPVEAGHQGTTMTFNGWMFGKGPGGKTTVRGQMRKFRSLVEEQATTG